MAWVRQLDGSEDVVCHDGAVRVHDRGAVHVGPAEAAVAGWHGLQRRGTCERVARDVTKLCEV